MGGFLAAYVCVGRTKEPIYLCVTIVGSCFLSERIFARFSQSLPRERKMTPTEQEIGFFTSEEAKRIQELWEPKFGDWVIDCERLAIVTGVEGDDVCVDYQDYGAAWCKRKEVVFLPRQGQLQAMLEERGCDIQTYILVLDQSEYRVKAIARPKKGDPIETFGPTPSIALGKCLLEVLKEE